MAVNINVPSQVKTYANLAAFPATGALKTIYIAEDTNKTYRWTGSVYVEVSASASGITIGSTAIASGVVGRVLFEGAGNVVQESSSLFWDNTNNRLGIGTSTPATSIDTTGIIRVGGTFVYGDTNNQYLRLSNVHGTFLGYNTSNIAIVASSVRLIANGVEVLRAFQTGNVLINTTTDAGFRLDVNGTARVQGQLTMAGDILFPSLGRRVWFPRGAGSAVMFSPSNEINSASQDAVVIMDSIYGKIAYGGGTHTFNALSVLTNINTGGSYNGIIRGYYYNPTLTSTTGVDHRAIETTSGRVIFGGLPTSSAGLPTGAIWNDAGTLKIV